MVGQQRKKPAPQEQVKGRGRGRNLETPFPGAETVEEKRFKSEQQPGRCVKGSLQSAHQQQQQVQPQISHSQRDKGMVGQQREEGQFQQKAKGRGKGRILQIPSSDRPSTLQQKGKGSSGGGDEKKSESQQQQPKPQQTQPAPQQQQQAGPSEPQQPQQQQAAPPGKQQQQQQSKQRKQKQHAKEQQQAQPPQQQQSQQRYGDEAAGYQQPMQQGFGRGSTGRPQQPSQPGPPPGLPSPQQMQGFAPPQGWVPPQQGAPQLQGPRVPVRPFFQQPPQQIPQQGQGPWARRAASGQQQYPQSMQQPPMQQPPSQQPPMQQPYMPQPPLQQPPTQQPYMQQSPTQQSPTQQPTMYQQQPGSWGRRATPGQQQYPQSMQQPPMQQPAAQQPPMQQPPMQQQQQQQARGWGSRQATPEVTPLPSPAPSSQDTSPPSREMSMSPETQQQQEQPAQQGGGQKKRRQRQRQGQRDGAQPAGTAQPVSQEPQQPVTSPQEQTGQGAVPKQQPDGRGQPQPVAPGRQPQQQASQHGEGDRSEGVEQIQRSMGMIAIKGGGDVPLIQAQERKVMRQGGKDCRKKIMVYTNHFPLSLGKLTRALHYDVTIEPDKPKKLFRPAVEAFRQAFYKNRYPAFDGMKNLYSAHPLCTKEMSGKVKVLEDGREREFTITIKQVAYVDLSCLNDYFTKIGREGLEKPMQALQCIDIILRSAPSLNCIPAGRSYFNIPVGGIVKLGDGTELFNGFYQSAVLGWKPFLNLDVAHKAFPMQMSVVDYINEITGNRADPNSRLRPYDEEMLQRHMRQLKVHYEIPRVPGTKRIWRVNGLGDSPNRSRFTDDKGRVTSVENYFASEKGVRLKYPNWPTLWVGSTNRENRILLPLEFCTILRGQAVNKKMTETQTRAMIKEAATSAPTRLQKIRDSMSKAQYNQSPAVNEFGITVSEQPQKVQARVLEPPTLEYAQGRKEIVSRGVWRGTRFQTGVKIQKWTIICLDKRTLTGKLDDLESSLVSSGRKYGVEIPQATRDSRQGFLYLEEDYRNPKMLKQRLTEYFKNAIYELIVVVVPDNSKNAYAYVKQAAELAAGRLTQCIRSRTLMRLNPTTTDNIMLKVNAKLNGVNHILSTDFRPSCFKKPVVVMGADVTHPSPDSQNIPSVAAVTCSYDRQGFKYIFSWRLQEPKLEIIKDLETIVIEQLRYFKERNNCEPLRIIFFRDGVSDGQFAEVRSSELRAIRNACSKLNPNYKPQISFFVVQKRHHTRLFPVDDRDSEDRNKNVPAGTCIDTVITHPSVYDFYLVSHASIQGVAKPTKYVPLWDDADMCEDDIQHLTYYLCHLFARCNRSVSYPTPTYYAHLAAARAKVYIETETIDMTRLDEIQRRLRVDDSIIRRLPMYFV